MLFYGIVEQIVKKGSKIFLDFFEPSEVEQVDLIYLNLISLLDHSGSQTSILLGSNSLEFSPFLDLLKEIFLTFLNEISSHPSSKLSYRYVDIMKKIVDANRGSSA